MKKKICIRSFLCCCFFCLFADGVTKKKALIFGVTGQDGSYLAEFLLNKGYEVHGVKRRCSSFNTTRIDHLNNYKSNLPCNNFFLHYGDLVDSLNVVKLVSELKPDEIYNLGAQSHVQVSFDLPEYTSDCDGIGVLRILEAIRLSGLTHTTRFYQASTSELFGKVCDSLQNENSVFYPRSPYAAAKLYAFWITKNYREAYGIFACNGILFNHESERRTGTFITRKITRAIASIVHKKQDFLCIGNLDAMRDWGYAGDYVEAMWLMLQQSTPDDYVVATGETHSVREFIERAFSLVNITIVWQGKGLEEVGVDKNSGRVLVKVDLGYFRPTEVDFLCGDASKARNILGWFPRVKFDELIKIMMTYDLCHVDLE